MINAWLRFVLSQRLLVGLFAAALTAGGIWAWRTLPIDAFPDVTNVQVMILTDASGLAPVDVEQQVTLPIELSMQGLPLVRQVRSLSKAGLSQVVVVFEDDVDTYFARQLVFERLQGAREELPDWARPELGPISTGLGEVFQWTLESPTLSPMELRTLQDWVVAPQVRALAGVTEVNSFGGFLKQYQVVAQPDRLVEYGLTLDEISEAIGRNNANAGGNFLERGWEQSYVRSAGQAQGADDLEAIVLKTVDGVPVRLGDVAEVQIGPAPRQGAVTRDGKGEAVAGMAIMLKGANSREVVDRIRATLPRIEASLPDGVKINVFYDRIGLIRACIATVRDALVQGAALVLVVLFVFLGRFRAALVTASAVVFSALFTFVLMGTQGLTANLMSLGGLAIAIGMLADAAIVVVENVARHLAERGDSGLHRRQITLEATQEVARPVLFATLIVVVVFLPILTLGGMEGKMFRPLATAVCFALVGSLLAAFSIVPALASACIPVRGTGKDHSLLTWLRRGYLAALDAVLRRRTLTVVLALAALAGAAALAPRIGTEFLPVLDEGSIAINVVRLPTASLQGSVEVGTMIERLLRERFPEIETVVTKTGRAEISEDPMGPEQNDFVIMLKPRNEWTTVKTKAELVKGIEEELMRVPGIRPSFSQPIALRVNELISGIKSDLAIKIFGTDLELLRERANAAAVVLRELRGAEDVKVEQVAGFAQIEITPDRAALARRGLAVADVNDLVETAVGGKIVSQLREGQRQFDITVRYPPEARRDLAALGRLLIPAPDGARVRLDEVAALHEIEAPAQISRESGMRRVVVECNVRGRDLGSFVNEVREKIRPIEDGLPSGSYIELGGQFENQQRAMRRLSVVVPLAVLMIFIMLCSALGSVRDALLVFANLPFALVGGLLALVLLRINLSVSATIGFIALFGIAVGNGIVLVSFISQLRRSGVRVAEAVRQACELRFRPLLMTALTTLLGLVPMIWTTGSGSEIQRPLAAVVIGGLLTSTALTLFVLPVVYLWVEAWRPAKDTLD